MCGGRGGVGFGLPFYEVYQYNRGNIMTLLIYMLIAQSLCSGQGEF